MGLSGKTRIQIRPPRLMWRLIARRAASIWRAVRRPRPVAFKPYSPNDTCAPRVARPVLRPLCSLRYFLREGCNMVILLRLAPLRRQACGVRGHDHLPGDVLRDDHRGGDASDALRHEERLPRGAFRRWATCRPCRPTL